MLDGLLNRGFSSKCKSLMKDVMKRLEVLRRRVEAMQRFLKEDLVKLLANGLDIDAYGRTEEFLAGLNLLSCYDFITYTCEYILKLLSSMQKQRECPEDCREAVASLMFAAARVSDLPELRDLRDLFQERYGSEMKCFVNQKFLEKLSSLPTTAAKRLQLLQDISTEFFIKWDCKAFEQRMAGGGSSTNTQVYSSRNNGFDGNANGVISKKSDASPKPRHIVNDKETHLLYHENPEKRGREHLPLNTTKRKEQVHKREEGRVDKNESSNNKDDNLSNMLKPPFSSSSIRKKHMDITATPYGVESKNSGKEPVQIQKPTMMKSDRTMHKEDVDGLKNNKNNVALLPPPYVKSIHNPIPPPYTKPNKPDDAISKREGSVAVGNANQKQTNLVHDDNHKIQPLPRPRSVRKKHHNKSSAQYDDDEDDDSSNIKRSSSSRRKGNSRKGLQILFDDENHGKDEEERIMDKLLIHYSKKSSAYDEAAGKTRRHVAGAESNHPHPAVQQRGTSDIGESSSHNVSNSMRSISLPNEQKQNVATETTKRFDRVQSFQPDNRASHVHPKLPEYDDLAAQFAALRGG